MPKPARKLPNRAPRPLPVRIAKGYERYLEIVLKYPGTEQAASYGTPAVKVAGKLISRWRTEAEGALGIRCDFIARQILLQTQPDVFFITDHYKNSAGILVRLDKIRKDALADIVERAWRMVAPKKLIQQWEGASSTR
jgi:hypothetical protein